MRIFTSVSCHFRINHQLWPSNVMLKKFYEIFKLNAICALGTTLSVPYHKFTDIKLHTEVSNCFLSHMASDSQDLIKLSSLNVVVVVANIRMCIFINSCSVFFSPQLFL